MLSSLLTVGCCAQDGVHGETVSQRFLPSLMWAFPCSPDEYESLRQFLGFFFVVVVLPYIAADLVCSWEEVSLKTLLCCHLELDSGL